MALKNIPEKSKTLNQSQYYFIDAFSFCSIMNNSVVVNFSILLSIALTIRCYGSFVVMTDDVQAWNNGTMSHKADVLKHEEQC